MNIKHFITLAILALVSLGGLGRLTTQAYAQAVQPLAQVQRLITPDREQADSATVQAVEQTTPDTATDGNDSQDGQEQVDPQDAPDTSAETANDQERQAVPPISQPAITAAAAQQTAEAYLKAGRASQVALDDEHGQFVYRVQIGNTEVQVDASSGAVLDTATTDE